MTTATNGLQNAVPYKWTYADATARTSATGFVAADVGSWAVQLDDGTVWELTATTPTWTQRGGGSGMTNPMTTADDVIIGGSSGTPTRLAKGSNNTVLGVDGSGVLGYKADPSGGGSLTTASANLGTDVTLTQNAWADILSLSLAAGTWLVWAGVSLNSGAGPETVDVRISDGTTHYGSAEHTFPASGYVAALAVTSEPIVLASTTTIKVQGFAQNGLTAPTAKATAALGATKATWLRALQVA